MIAKQILPLWVKFLVLLSVVSFLGTGIIWLINPALLAPPSALTNGSISYGANVVADYLAMRHFVLGFSLLLLLLRKSSRMLGFFLLAAGSIQALDAITDIAHKAVPAGPVILSIINFTAGYYILSRKSRSKVS